MPSTLGILAPFGSPNFDFNDTDVIVAAGGFTVGSDTLIVNGQIFLGTPWPVDSSTQKWRFVVFGDNGAGAPNTTVRAISSELLIDNTHGGGVTQTIAFPGSQTLTTGQKVWLALWYGTTTGTSRPTVPANTTGTMPPDHQFYNVATTYSTGSNPSVSGWTDGGINAYVMYLNMDVATVVIPTVAYKNVSPIRLGR